jgi:hypothetical protein
MGDTASAEASFDHAIGICRRDGLFLQEADVLSDLGLMQKMAFKRLPLLLEARRLYDSLSPSSFSSANNREELGDTYLKMYQADPANLQYLSYAAGQLDTAIAKFQALKDPASLAQAYEDMAQVEAVRGRYRSAYNYSNRYHAINDSIFSQQNKNTIAALESKSELDKKNQEIEKGRLEVSEQRKNIYLLVTGVLLVGAVGLLYFRLSRIRQARNRELADLNKKLDDANR